MKKTEDLLRFYGTESPDLKKEFTLETLEKAIKEMFYDKSTEGIPVQTENPKDEDAGGEKHDD